MVERMRVKAMVKLEIKTRLKDFSFIPILYLKQFKI